MLLAICWFYLVRIAFPLKYSKIPGARQEIHRQLQQLGKISYEEKWVLFVFSATAIAWISRTFVLTRFMPEINDTIIALLGALCLFLIPAKNGDGMKILDWETATKLPWGIILLFGGGLCLATGFKDTGLAAWMGNQLTLFNGVQFIIILGVVIASVNFLTEITSNVATASVILPILASLSVALGLHPFGLMIAATVAASCAFMLPVATPPNAVVFSSGYIRMQDMVRTGIWMNMISILFLTLYVKFILPLVWDLDLRTVPESIKQHF